MIGFQLGREYKLSVAEILAVFPEGKTVYLSEDFLILENIKELDVLSKCNRLGGAIKIIKILENNISELAQNHEGKFKYGISVFGDKKNLKAILIKQKNELKEIGVSSRFVNKDFSSLSSAQILGENLINRKTDFNYIFSKDEVYFGITIWVQNINEYSKRDYSKDRDMQTGMLPPKLCQMMINISGGNKVYDPFVGLGTVLIESINMGNKEVYGSDLSERMVDITTNNINNFIKTNKITLDNYEIFKLNAKYIEEAEILIEKDINSIVTEGYLGEMMTQKNISIERIEKQKQSLIELYSRFFEGLNKINYKGNIVICFPFWEFKGEYIYLTSIGQILDKYCTTQTLFPEGFKIETTKAGSLLYKREKQLVGREIYKLKLK